MAKFGPGWAWVLTYEEPFDMTITKTLCPVGLITFPMTVAGLTAVTETAGIRLSWTLSTDGSVTSSYRVKRGSDWGSAVLVADNVLVNNATDANVFNGNQYTYLVKGVSPTGRESETTATVTITATGIEQVNVILNDVEEPAWAGVRTNIELVGATLVAPPSPTAETIGSGTATGFNSVDPYFPSYAFDGNLTSQWRGISNSTYVDEPGSTPCWLKYDYGVGAGRIPTQVKIKPSYVQYIGVNYSTIRHVTLEGSNDDAAWTRVATLELADDPGGTEAWQTFSFFNTVRYRYLKFVFWTSYRVTGGDTQLRIVLEIGVSESYQAPFTASYESTPYDIGQKWWSYVNVEADASLNIEDGAWSDYFPTGGTWGDAFPDESAGWQYLQSSGIVTIELAFTDDDPAGAPTWGPWVPFEQKKYNFRGVKCRVSATLQNVNQTFTLSGLRTICDVDDVTIHVANFSIGIGGTTLTYANYTDTAGRTGAFLGVPISIKGLSRDNSQAISIDITNRTATTCKATAYDSAGASVAATADITIIGY